MNVSPPTPQINNVTKSPIQSTVSTLTSTASDELRPIKKTRDTSTQAQQKRVNDVTLKIRHNMAHKKATTMYAAESKKPEGEKKLSAKQVSELVYAEYGVDIHRRNIQREVAAGRVGLSPLKTGPKGHFPTLTFQHLANAFESFIQIKQLNGQAADLAQTKLVLLLQKCTKHLIGCDCV
jgi:hypothetical protein